MTRFWWVRHGPTHRRCMVGWSDVAADLSDRPALERLSAALPARARLVSSDLARARLTADALAGPGRSRLPDMPALRELNFGAWELRSHAEVNAESPELIRAFMESPGDVSPPGGESWNALRARLDPAVDALAGQDGDVIVVAHFGPILAQVQRGLGISAYQAFAHSVEPLSLTETRLDAAGWQVARIGWRA